jgi:Tol biopolymer transport system component
LLNPRYQSWVPDGSALVFTAGGGRSAQANKWLNLFDVASSQVTTVVSETEQIPGIVAWSPRGDLIAFAAVPTAETGTDLAGWMVFENPAIAGRRDYLLDPATGRHRRLNDTETFQDAPTWSDDGAILYYVQREEDTMALMAADPATGQAQVVEGSRRPAPGAVGYYGQSDWDDLMAYCLEAP